MVQVAGPKLDRILSSTGESLPQPFCHVDAETSHKADCRKDPTRSGEIRPGLYRASRQAHSGGRAHGGRGQSDGSGLRPEVEYQTMKTDVQGVSKLVQGSAADLKPQEVRSAKLAQPLRRGEGRWFRREGRMPNLNT